MRCLGTGDDENGRISLGELNGIVPSESGPVKWNTERMEHAMIGGEPLTQQINKFRLP